MNTSFPQLNLPPLHPVIREMDGKPKILCLVRKKDIVLTPEEWVRQHFIHYLNSELSYPISLMKVESEIRVNRLKKRFDLVCYDHSGAMKLLVECKSASTPVGKNTFDQVARYNMALKVPYLIITNGLNHFCAGINLEDSSVQYLKNIPKF